MTYVLVTDIEYRKTFDTISILIKEFPSIEVILGTTKNGFYTGLCYGSCNKVQLRTDEGYESFAFDLNLLQTRYEGHDIVYLPVEEKTTEYFIRYISLVNIHKVKWSYKLPSETLFNLFRNKEKLNSFCLSNRFPAPITYKVEDVVNVNCKFPLIFKPVIGSGSKGIFRLFNSDQITTEIIEKLNSEKYLVQELIDNGRDVCGCFFLCKDGKVLSAYTHSRVRTFPIEGGVTVLSKMQYNESILKQGKELIEFVKWEGLLMLEYLWDDNSQSYKLIEANPRLWGSIMLSEYGGAYLLTNYVRLCVGLPLREMQIDTRKQIRWLFPMDLLNWIKTGFKIKDFWNLSNTCFINWSFARKDRALFFIIINIFNFNNIIKFFSRK